MLLKKIILRRYYSNNYYEIILTLENNIKFYAILSHNKYNCYLIISNLYKVFNKTDDLPNEFVHQKEFSIHIKKDSINDYCSIYFRRYN